MAIRLSGMASGLDTDAIVQDLVKAYSTKKDKFVKQQTKTTWIMDSWKDVNSKVYGFYTNTLSNMRYSTNYNLRSASISNSSIAQVSASTGAVTSTQTLAVKQLATSGYLTGGKIEGNGTKVTNSTKLSDLGITEGTIMINDRKIELKGDMSLASLTSQFKAGEVSANFDEGTGRFFISSKTSGLDAEFSLTSGDAKGFEALQKLGLVSYKDSNGNETADLQKYRKMADASFDAQALIDERYNKAKWTIESYTKSIKSKVDTATKNNESLQKSNETAQEKLDKLKADDYSWEGDYKTEADYNKAVEALEKKIDENNTKIADNQKIIDENQPYLDDEAKLSAKVDELNAEILSGIESDVTDEVAMARDIVSRYDAGELSGSNDAVRINAQDSIIKLNGATFTSNSNSYSINGLNINATSVTVTTETDADGNVIEKDNAVSINVSVDTQGIYDKIVDMFKQYNEMVAYMDGLYYADAADGYEPLTDEEMEAMTDKQIETWEEKAKSALLRKDSTLGAISSSLKSSVLGTEVMVGGTKYNLSTFGIATASYFSSSSKDRGQFHIDGNKDDSSVASNEDKLMAMISKDPDGTIRFFQELAGNMYDTLTKKMASNSMSSAFTIYNDKQMSSQYSEYTKRVEDWEEKIKDMEDSYYKKFAAMEKALSKLQSQSSSLGGLLGGQ